MQIAGQATVAVAGFASLSGNVAVTRQGVAPVDPPVVSVAAQQGSGGSVAVTTQGGVRVQTVFLPSAPAPMAAASARAPTASPPAARA